MATSKTAQAAAKAVENAERKTKTVVVLTPEQQIKAARELRAAKLFVPPHMIDTLLAEYDRLQTKLDAKGETDVVA
jgi:hypothetical protein